MPKVKHLFRPGQRVRLKPFEDQREEFGYVLHSEENGVVPVEIDVAFRDPEGDDGIREVPVDQIEVLR